MTLATARTWFDIFKRVRGDHGALARPIYSLLTAVVFLAAAWMRFRLPQMPWYDRDYWGYLNPALSALSGHGFVHSGRDTLYPGFLFGILKLTGDFRAVSIAQHLVGLGTGVLMLLSYRQGLRFLRGPSDGVSAFYPYLGLLAAMTYLATPSTIQFEHSLRPEAIFPFFVMLSIYLNLEFTRNCWIAPCPRTAAWQGAAQMVVSLAAYKLRPSFGFALVLANMPLAVALLTRGMPPRTKGLMVGSGATACALFLILPESLLKRVDPAAELFLPDTLLTIHADMVRDQIAADLDADCPSPFPRATIKTLLDRLNATLPASRLRQNHPYPSLGFNPDYLLYVDCVYHGVLPDTLEGYRQRAAIGKYYYLRTCIHQPGRMLQKIAGQLRLFYRFNVTRRTFSFKKGLRLSQAKPFRQEFGYHQNATLADQPNAVGQFDEYPPASALVAASRQLAQQPAVIRLNPALNGVLQALEILYLPSLLLTLCLATWTAWTGRWKQSEWWLPTAVALLLFGYNAGNNLTVAVVHSLSIHRYIENQLAYTLLASAFGSVFVIEAARKGAAASLFKSHPAAG